MADLQYVALKRLRIGDGFREVGESVPEAKDWKNVASYVSRGELAVVGAEPGLSPSTRGLGEARTPRGTSPTQVIKNPKE